MLVQYEGVSAAFYPQRTVSTAHGTRRLDFLAVVVDGGETRGLRFESARGRSRSKPFSIARDRINHLIREY